MAAPLDLGAAMTINGAIGCRPGKSWDPFLPWIPAFAGMTREEQQVVELSGDAWAWLDAIVGKLDDDFVQAVNQNPGQQERPRLEELVSPPPPKDEKRED